MLEDAEENGTLTTQMVEDYAKKGLLSADDVVKYTIKANNTQARHN